MPYHAYWKSEFQRTLTEIAGQGNLLRWEEISSSLDTETHKTWEYVYRYRLRNPSVSIVIFSSVCKLDDRSREVNSDAVRIVFEWHTKHGARYSKIAKKYRVDTLFENLKREVVLASNDCFDLGQYDWVSSVYETDV